MGIYAEPSVVGTISTPVQITGAIKTEDARIVGNISAQSTMTGSISVPAQITGIIHSEFAQLIGNISGITSSKQYTGEYEFTPAENTQIISINGLVATKNITINPIPNDYGRVIWDGVTLTII